MDYPVVDERGMKEALKVRGAATVQGLSLDAVSYAKLAIGLILGCWAVTYGIYLAQGKDPFLPTISNTWDHAPGTYFGAERRSCPSVLALLWPSRGRHQQSNAAKISSDGARTAEIGWRRRYST